MNVLNYKRHGLPIGTIYIGRPMPQLPDEACEWGNPFKIEKGASRELVIQRYALWLDEQLLDPIFGAKFDATFMGGPDVVCWCAPELCHGDIIRDRALRRGLFSLTNGPIPVLWHG